MGRSHAATVGRLPRQLLPPGLRGFPLTASPSSFVPTVGGLQYCGACMYFSSRKSGGSAKMPLDGETGDSWTQVHSKALA